MRWSGGRNTGQTAGTTAPVRVTAAVQTEVAAGGDVAAEAGHQQAACNTHLLSLSPS